MRNQEKSGGPAERKRNQEPPIFAHGGFRTREDVHKGAVDSERDRQNAARYPRQNRARADEHPAEEMPSPRFPPLRGRRPAVRADASRMRPAVRADDFFVFSRRSGSPP